MDVYKLIFLDECSVNTGMTRLYARGMSHERIVDYVPDVRFERTSLLSSVRLNGDAVPLVFEGSLNGDLFKAYISNCLAPTLHQGDIVIMDNLTSHKVKGVAELISATGACVLHLPPRACSRNLINVMIRSEFCGIIYAFRGERRSKSPSNLQNSGFSICKPYAGNDLLRQNQLNLLRFDV